MIPLIQLPVSRLCITAAVILFSAPALTTAANKIIEVPYINTLIINASSDTDTYHEFEVEYPPECLNLSEVQDSFIYPDSAKKMGIEGNVIVWLLINRVGNVIKTGDISGPDIFYGVIKNKVFDLHFSPGMDKGKTVKVWVKMTFKFKLEK